MKYPNSEEPWPAISNKEPFWSGSLKTQIEAAYWCDVKNYLYYKKWWSITMYKTVSCSEHGKLGQGEGGVCVLYFCAIILIFCSVICLFLCIQTLFASIFCLDVI